MAERRMFSRGIVNSARFLRMPQTSRLLYYDLGMAADDDGIVEAFTVLRTTGAAEDDLRVLASRGFVTVLNEDLVSYITDWSTNNQIRKDRYRPSLYSELLVQISDGNQCVTNGLPVGNQCVTQGSIGKSSQGEARKERKADKPPARPRFIPPTLEEIETYVQETGSCIDSQNFLDYYTSNGWKVGRNPMRNWKAAVRTWANREDKGGQEGGKCRQHPSEPGDDVDYTAGFHSADG